MLKLFIHNFAYSLVLIERHGSLLWNFSGRLYWALLGRLYWGQSSKWEIQAPLFKHQRVRYNPLKSLHQSSRFFVSVIIPSYVMMCTLVTRYWRGGKTCNKSIIAIYSNINSVFGVWLRRQGALISQWKVKSRQSFKKARNFVEWHWHFPH